ncbi:dienelactone hydrolase family protein [uncultured Friedmanniella sp.]|uniref:dienelactone hydrolase family protein n=1 Tax=uncultured Friedmanniella sp. TaxID=335381 RepID=UPI0035CB9F1F
MTPTSPDPAAPDSDPGTKGRTIEVQTADGPMPSYLCTPPSGTGPGIVLVQEIFGVGDYIRDRAADLAALGYVVLAPEVYWRLPESGIDPEGDVLAQAMGLVQQVDWELAVSDVSAAVEHVRGMIEVDGGVGLLGFCFGGGLAFNVAAVTPVDVLVSYYGSALPGLLGLAERVTTPSLHHFGTADAYIATEAQDAIRAAVTANGARFETYDGANHAFDNPSPMFHHAEASVAAWAETVQFLAEHLGGSRV